MLKRRRSPDPLLDTQTRRSIIDRDTIRKKVGEMKKMIIIGFVLLGLTFASEAKSQTEPGDCKREFSAGYAYGFARAVGGSAAIYVLNLRATFQAFCQIQKRQSLKRL